jgi:hypothetical protein
MMDSLGRYLLGILASSLICGIAMELIGKKGSNSAAVKLLCGVFMLLSVMSPVLDVRIGALTDLTGAFQLEGDTFAQEGKNLAQEQYRSVITQRTEAYILDKAVSLGADVDVEVVLTDDDTSAPKAVTICGKISPYAKGLLSSWLNRELGIATEEQRWIASN